MRIVLILVAVVALAALSSCGGEVAPRPDLLFVSTRDGDYAIYEMNGDGHAQRRLTEATPDTSSPSGLYFQIDPAWSPDGSSIAFASRRAGSFDIYAMRSDGTGTRRLTATRGDDTHPTWSPDGARIAFERDGDIFVMESDGSPARPITRTQASDNDPAWSPSGAWIAFARRLPGESEREIWVMRPDGSGAKRLTVLHGSSINPSWSPDGSRLVFASNIIGSLYDLYVVGLADTRVRRLTRRGPDAIEPAWSPDGSTIAFAQDGSISTTDLIGQSEALTDSSNNDSSPAWNPRPPTGDE